MKKILLIGNCPLPFEKTNSRPAAGLRTHQFIQTLKDHKLLVVTIAMPECYKKEYCAKEPTTELPETFERITISKDDPKILSRLRQVYREYKPDAVVSVNTHPSYLVSKLRPDVPWWADLNGWIMAEGQAQAYKMNSNDYLPHYYEMESSIVSNADMISTVSQAQSLAAWGEAALLGRVNAETFGYEMIQIIPNATQWIEGESPDHPPVLDILDAKLPRDAFALLWIGGYNTWVDEETLFKGVEAAMAKCAKLYYVSTGGEISGLDSSTYRKFRDLVDRSEYKDRFIFTGWVGLEYIPYIYSRGNAGLNVDRFCLETLTGARNRINEMMKFGLPIITTLGTEISHEAVHCGAGLGVESGDFADLADKIEVIYGEWRDDGQQKYTKKGREYVGQMCTYHKTTENLRMWVKNLKFAPDKGIIPDFRQKNLWKKIMMGIKYLKNNDLKKLLNKIRQKIDVYF